MRKDFGSAGAVLLLIAAAHGIAPAFAASASFDYTDCGPAAAKLEANRHDNGWEIRAKDASVAAAATTKSFIRYRTPDGRCQLAAPMSANRSGFMIYADTGDDPPVLLIGQARQLLVVDWTGAPRTIRYDPIAGKFVSNALQGVQTKIDVEPRDAPQDQ